MPRSTLWYQFYRSLFLRETSCNQPYRALPIFQNGVAPVCSTFNRTPLTDKFKFYGPLVVNRVMIATGLF